MGCESLRQMEASTPFVSGSSLVDGVGAIDTIWTLCEDFVEPTEH